MPKFVQIFKGGFSRSHQDENGLHLAVNQRPADGHLKTATWEEYVRFNKDSFPCPQGKPVLEVGDVIALHALLTFGLIEAYGLAVLSTESGLRFQVVCSDNKVDLDKILVEKYVWADNANAYRVSRRGQKLGSEATDIGVEQAFYAGYANSADPVRVCNSAIIGLQITALPPQGLEWTFNIESRLQMRQPVRPPADLLCC